MAELSNEKRLRLAGFSQFLANQESNEVKKKALEATTHFLMGKHSLANTVCPSIEDMEEAGMESIESVEGQPKQGYTATQKK